ncbi:MAG: PriCT-2 domain-containing protein [Bacteroidetes bacterium]|nr:PriCT-2 domain-containing protein [Bacteroidota bacterium]
MITVSQIDNVVFFSKYANAKAPAPVGKISLTDLKNIMTSDQTVLDKVAQLRQLKSTLDLSRPDDKRKYQEFKLSNFGGFTPSGEFEYRDENGLSDYSKIVHVDLDNLPGNLLIKTFDDVCKQRGVFASVVFAMVSPGGDGLKIFHAVSSPTQLPDAVQFHYHSYDRLTSDYVSHDPALKSHIDFGCHDISRLCYFSHDASFFLSQSFTPADVDYESFLKKNERHKRFLSCYEMWHVEQPVEFDDATSVLDELLHYLTDKKLSITKTYDQWYRVLFALRASLPEQSAYSYARKFSQLDPNFNEAEFEIKINSMRRKFKRDVSPTIGTILHYAAQVGFRSKLKNRLAIAARFDSVVHMLCKYDVTMRYNTFTKRYEFLEDGKYVDFDDRRLDWIHTNVLSQSMKRNDVSSFLHARAPKHDPVKEFVASMPAWDNVDRLHSLIETLNPRSYVDREFMAKLFKLWCVNFFKQALDNQANEYMVVLQGAQGVGKTRWVKKLFKDFFDQYYEIFFTTKNLDPKKKDDLFILSEKLVVFNDELAEVLRDYNDSAALKSALSNESNTLRQAYGRYNTDNRRTASMLGAVNDAQLIKDDTGARRFWVIECGDIDYQHNVDVKQFWAQMYSIYLTKEELYVDSAENKTLSDINSRFDISTQEEDVIREHLVADMETGQPLTPLQAYTILCEAYKEYGLKINYQTFSRKMSKVFGPTSDNDVKRLSRRATGKPTWVYFVSWVDGGMKVNAPVARTDDMPRHGIFRNIKQMTSSALEESLLKQIK